MEVAHDVPRTPGPIHPRWWLLPYRALGIALAVFAAYLLLAKVAGAVHRFQGVILFLAPILGVTGSLYWTWREPRIDSVRLQGVLEVLVRYALVSIFISYGMAKLYRSQFSPPSFFQLEQPVGDLAGIDLTWRFFGHSYAYACLIALSQIASSLLLFFRRTQLLGACLLLPVIGNIVFINFAYDIPVQLFSTAYLLMTLWLVLADSGRLKALFWDDATVPPRARPAWDPRYRILRAAARLAFIVAAFASPAWTQHQIGGFLKPHPTPIAGAWRVQRIEGPPAALPGAADEGARWEKLFFETAFGGHAGTVAFPAGEGHEEMTYTVDAPRRAVEMKVEGRHPARFAGSYELLPAGKLVLAGRLDGAPVRIELKRLR